ncbi:MAG: hypothetical protein U0Y68_25455 [Blastocatellia bacterium]
MNIHWKIPAHGPILFYRTTQWDGLKLVHWRVRAGELAETTFARHEISLALTGQFTTTKQTATRTTADRAAHAAGNVSWCLRGNRFR